MRENKFQRDLIKEIKKAFPGCIVLKNDEQYLQGIPDLTVLYRNKWCVLECKKSPTEVHQPNQDYYVEKLNEMSYSTFIFPENKDEVMEELHRIFDN